MNIDLREIQNAIAIASPDELEQLTRYWEQKRNEFEAFEETGNLKLTDEVLAEIAARQRGSAPPPLMRTFVVQTSGSQIRFDSQLTDDQVRDRLQEMSGDFAVKLFRLRSWTEAQQAWAHKLVNDSMK